MKKKNSLEIDGERGREGRERLRERLREWNKKEKDTLTNETQTKQILINK